MHPVINHLTQLQELVMIRDERKLGGVVGGDVSGLDGSIEEMAAQLPDETRVMYGKLLKRGHTFITPVSQGGCAGCGLKLPISLVQSVRAEKELQHCPSCTRFLYFPTSMARRVGAGPRRGDPPKVGIARFSSEVLMVPRLEAEDRDGVIRELAATLQARGFVDDAASLVAAALRREELCSTAVEHGLAFPHVRGVEGGGLTLALGLSAKGVDFGGTQKTRIFFFLVIPTAASPFYLKLLAGLAETFADAKTRQDLLKCKDAAETWKALVKLTRKTVK